MWKFCIFRLEIKSFQRVVHKLCHFFRSRGRGCLKYHKKFPILVNDRRWGGIFLYIFCDDIYGRSLEKFNICQYLKSNLNQIFSEFLCKLLENIDQISLNFWLIFDPIWSEFFHQILATNLGLF